MNRNDSSTIDGAFHANKDSMIPKFKIFADPVHGFISVPKDLILSLLETPEVQRLRRIRQMGLGNLVYPGGEHTRFSHALGAMALMQDALNVLWEKGTPISSEEYTAALAAALLHDVGHGPFSHTLEHVLISEFEHEDMSRVLIKKLNTQYGGKLDLVLDIFENTYSRPFFYKLVASQLDMDRLDYLRRDSFFTGVAEGVVGVDRIIKTLRVHPLAGGSSSGIAIEHKGAYAVENFLFARRSMYWQVYLHKTVLAGDRLLSTIIERARILAKHNEQIRDTCSPALLFFLIHDIKGTDIEEPDVIQAYCELDDSDITYTLKSWSTGPDPVLADLCQRFTNRSFFRIRFLENPLQEEERAKWRHRVEKWIVSSFSVSHAEASELVEHYLFFSVAQHVSYEHDNDPINVIHHDETISELSTTTDTGAITALTHRVVKPYVCYPKELDYSHSPV